MLKKFSLNFLEEIEYPKKFRGCSKRRVFLMKFEWKRKLREIKNQVKLRLFILSYQNQVCGKEEKSYLADLILVMVCKLFNSLLFNRR